MKRGGEERRRARESQREGAPEREVQVLLD